MRTVAARPSALGWSVPALGAGLGMIAASLLTVRHYFAANYPQSIWEGSFCDLTAFLNCDSSAFSPLAAVAGVPIGLFGAMLGGLVCLGVVFRSDALERTNRFLLLANLAGIVALFTYSAFFFGSLCLLCTAYYVFSILALALLARFPHAGERESFARRWLRPSLRVLVVFSAATLVEAAGVAAYDGARRAAQSGGVAARVVAQFAEVPEVEWPSVISPLWTIRSTERFDEAPVQIVEYGDLLCPDCRYLNEQVVRLEAEFPGRINVAFQFFPLEARCNAVVEKDKHPGACDLSYMAAYDPAKFKRIHDEIFAHQKEAKREEWRRDLARRYGVEAALTDSSTIRMVRRLIETGAEYEKTSEEYSHGIRSTPTLIINRRMVIGTFPYEQLRAIVQYLIDEHERAGERFLESWVE